ncbi:hypothetical protein EYF80_008164 [Liparis tanakae]|uniref:Uncharacterized protein n=1 Tax=Liparis tanakae TaxID=230148 RepID=A0A4Z2IW31_9TELE|nr:hypothetical protein EYF80_008164 [Liparis tanakae]
MLCYHLEVQDHLNNTPTGLCKSSGSLLFGDSNAGDPPLLLGAAVRAASGTDGSSRELRREEKGRPRVELSSTERHERSLHIK